VESIGVERTLQRVQKAALLIYLFDLSTTTPEELTAELQALNPQERIPVLAVANKADIATSDALAAFAHLPYVLPIAAATGAGLEELKEALLQKVRGAGLDRTGTATIVTNLRHARSLEASLDSLDAVLQGLANNQGTELLAADLRRALASLGEITGEISSDDLLTSIFTQFCIGK
jgi:tRNA modification GTPase